MIDILCKCTWPTRISILLYSLVKYVSHISSQTTNTRGRNTIIYTIIVLLHIIFYDNVINIWIIVFFFFYNIEAFYIDRYLLNNMQWTYTFCVAVRVSVVRFDRFSHCSWRAVRRRLTLDRFHYCFTVW